MVLMLQRKSQWNHAKSIVSKLHVYHGHCVNKILLRYTTLASAKELDEKWPTFFYVSNVAFNVARHLVFIATVKAININGKF